MRTLNFAIYLLMFSLMSTLLMPAQAAVELKQLYQARVPVASQAAADRTLALQEALQRTFLKVSGDSSLLEHQKIRFALQNVRQFVQQYGYQQTDEELLLWVQFDQNQIDRTIQESGSGVWSHVRPELLFWVVIEDETLQRSLVGTADANPFLDQLRYQAQIRGLPIKLPLLDLNDTMTLSVLDVWARFEDRIEFASSRYAADGIVVARAYQADQAVTNDTWMIDWTLRMGALRFRGELTAADFDALGQALIADITQQLAQRYRISGSAELAGVWQVDVINLTSMQDVLNAEQRLSDVPSVNRVQLVEYGNHVARFTLNIQTDASQIMQALDVSRQFEPVGAEQRNHRMDTLETPVYRWSQP